MDDMSSCVSKGEGNAIPPGAPRRGDSELKPLVPEDKV